MEDRQAGTGAQAAPGDVVSGWRLTVDAGRCIGSGLCASTASRHFHLEGRVSQPVAEVVEPDEAVRDAADFCPAEAIEVRDAGTAELVAPQP
jgi:ferredoxin